MSALTEFDIAYKGLSNGRHQYDYCLTDEFFAEIEDSLITTGKIDVKVNLDKCDEMLTFNIEAEGSIDAVCDICLGDMTYDIEDCEGRIVVKFSDEYEEVSEELYVFPREQDVINIAQWIYEIIAVSLPICFEHPLDEEGNRTCDPEMLAKLEELSVGNTNNGKDDSEPVDPRWAGLKELLNK